MRCLTKKGLHVSSMMKPAGRNVANLKTHKTRTMGALAIALTLVVAGCGITYKSPKVTERADGAPVNVVALNAQTVVAANQSPYTPKSLPEVFYAATGYGSGGAVGAGALPAAPYLPTETRQALDFRPPPDAPKEPYRIGVGDVLLLATKTGSSSVEQLTGLLAAQNQRQGYSVRDDGSIAIPDVGPVQLAGLTVQQAEDRLFQVLVQAQIDPAFSLEVAEFNSQRIAVGGAVRNPTIVPVTLTRVTLGEALTAAGSLTVRDEEFASIRIYREGNLYQIPVSVYLDRPDLQKKVLINGDAIYVDTTYDLDRAMDFYQARLDVISLRSSARATAMQSLQSEISLQRASLDERRSLFQARESLGAEDRDYVYLTGEVNQQSRFPLPYNNHATLADVLYSEGGFDVTTGDPSQIYVLRGSSDPSHVGEITAFHLDARNAADLVFATRLQMRPNDIVFVEEQPITKWGRALQQLFPVVLNAAQNGI